MDDVKLPRHVIDRLEHRWANRLQQDAKAWSGERGSSVRFRPVQSCGARAIPGTGRRSRRAGEAPRAGWDSFATIGDAQIDSN